MPHQQHSRRMLRRNQRIGRGSSEQTLADPSNQEQIEAMSSGLTGSLGRLFARILGVAEDSNDAADMAFGQDQLEDYIRDQLDFAEGEWFRKTKITGVAEKLMAELDQNQDGLVDWQEFQGSVTRLKTALGITSDTVTAEEVAESGGAVYDQLDTGSEAQMDEIQGHISSELPASTEHLDLVAQFAARMVIDLADTDQRELPISDRSITREEWVSAATDLADI